MIELKLLSIPPSFFRTGICKLLIHMPESSSTQHFYASGTDFTSVSTALSVQPVPYLLRIYGAHQPCVPCVTCLVEGSVIEPGSVTLAETFGICSVTKSVTEIYTDGSYFLNVPAPYFILLQPDGVAIHRNPLAINLVTPSQTVFGDDIQIVFSNEASSFAEIKVSASTFTQISHQIIIGYFIQYIYQYTAQTSFTQFGQVSLETSTPQSDSTTCMSRDMPLRFVLDELWSGSLPLNFDLTCVSDSVPMSRDMPLRFVLDELWSGSLPLNFDLTCVSDSVPMSRDMPLQFVLDVASDRAMPLTATL